MTGPALSHDWSHDLRELVRAATDVSVNIDKSHNVAYHIIFIVHRTISILMLCGCVGGYVTTFCYLSMCKPMAALVSSYLTVLVVCVNQSEKSRRIDFTAMKL